MTAGSVDRPVHWDSTYEHRAQDTLSWFQTEPTTSLRLVHEVLATFAPDGPEVCSSLPVLRYGPDELASVLADGFEPVQHEREEHVTPDGRVQPFTWVVLRRRSGTRG